MPESTRLSRVLRKPAFRLALAGVVVLGASADIVLATSAGGSVVRPAAVAVPSAAPARATQEKAAMVAALSASLRRGSPDGSDLAARIAADPALRRSLLALRNAAAKPAAGKHSATTPIIVGGLVSDIPRVAIAAYTQAANATNIADPSCHIPWTLIAGIGRVESDHGQFGGSRPDASGEVSPAILGPVLDGSADTAAISDTDGGRYDHDTRWDRAVGPMQFIPSSWATGGRDGNGDGVADPENLFDAARATGDYLCASGGDLRTAAASERAVLSYNHSWDYVLVVLGYAGSYAGQDISAISADIASHLNTPASVALLASVYKALRLAQLKAYFKAHAKHPKPAAHKSKPKPSKSPSRAPSNAPSKAPTPSPTHSPTPAPSATVTPTPTVTPTATPTVTPTPTPSPSSSVTPGATASPSPSATPSPVGP